MEIGRTERLIACSDNYSFVQYSSYIRGGGQFQRKYFGRGAWYKNEGLTDLSERKVFTRRRRGRLRQPLDEVSFAYASLQPQIREPTTEAALRPRRRPATHLHSLPPWPAAFWKMVEPRGA